MADYPDSIYSPRTKENRSGVSYEPTKKSVLFAEDISKLDAEVVALETELGANPKGGYASVAAFLVALAGKTIFTDFIDLLNWQSLDGYYTTVSADCTVTPNASAVELYIDAVGNKYAVVQTTAYYRFPLTAGKLITIEFQLIDINSITANGVWLGFGMPWDIPPHVDDDFVGFFIEDGLIYGRCGNDGSHTDLTTGITLSTGLQRTRLRLVFNPTVDCKFYVNDVLKCTIDTTLKGYESGRIIIGQKTWINSSNSIQLGRVLIQKIY